MALLSGSPRTATVRAMEEADLLAIGKADFERLVASKPVNCRGHPAAEAASALSAICTLANPSRNLDESCKPQYYRLSRDEANKFLAEAAEGSGLAIVLGNILDTIPGCLVIGAKFTGLEMLSLTLMLGMFLGTIPEAAASAAMLLKAGYRPKAVYGLWSTVIVAAHRRCRRWQSFHRDERRISCSFFASRSRRSGARACRSRDDPRSHRSGGLARGPADRCRFPIRTLPRARRELKLDACSEATKCLSWIVRSEFVRASEKVTLFPDAAGSRSGGKI